MKAIILDSDTPLDAYVSAKVFKDSECISVYGGERIVEVLPVSFLENCEIAHKTIAELIGDYKLDTMYGGDIVNWILEEYREKHESNFSD